MKKLYAVLFTLSISLALPAQVVLNEIYADPSPSNSEFFELYNTSFNGNPTSMDNYTVISYFEDGNKKGFNVIDLPNISIPAHGYLVGSSSIPFNYQGNMGSSASDFNWNSPTLPANYGYLKRFVATGNTAPDGAGNYLEEALPSTGITDFFRRQVGNGASYNAFVFKNGVLINSFIGGTGGVTKMPNYITAMANFQLENVTSNGNNTYNVEWKTFDLVKPEFVTQDIGTDNGFIRKRDGMCGTWVKSSSTVQHTPKTTNGGSQMDVDGELTIDTHIYSVTDPVDKPFVVYNITNGPSNLFPVELHVYADNGSVAGELDANDTFVAANTENQLSDGPFTTYIEVNVENVLIVAKTAAGCFDQIITVRNPHVQMSVLPVKLKLFTGKGEQSSNRLEWVVASNEAVHSFEVLKSLDGKVYKPVDIVSASAKAGEAYYVYNETTTAKAYYKIKVSGKDQNVFFSPVVLVEHPGYETENKLNILQNPVQATLSIMYYATETAVQTLTIYNASGMRVHSEQIAVQKGQNKRNLVLGQKLPSGMFILEITGNGARATERFVKQ
ncbi:MAG TPA: T9SS type A sorting domain-containing protein [Flavisolibacter sp.]|jgi:hypothetical protein|nr:T9SS type A sorting domain-containing protein [Flavisolibacter sp.]